MNAVTGVIVAFAAGMVGVSVCWRLAWGFAGLAFFANGLGIALLGYQFRLEVFAVTLIGVRLLVGRNGRRRERGAGPVAVLVLGWLLFAWIVSALVSIDPLASFSMAVQLTVAVVAGYCAMHVPLSYVERVQILHRCLGVVVAVSIVMVILSGGSRLKGLAFEPNIMGSMCVLWLAFLGFLSARRALPRFGVGDRSVVILVSAGVILSTTRAAWLALLVVAVGFVVRNRNARTALLIASGALCVGGIALLAYIQSTTWPIESWQWRVENFAALDVGTGAYRLDVWDEAIKDIQTRGSAIWWGTGLNSFGQLHPVDATSVAAAYLSSLWLGVVYDTGLIGSLLVGGGLLAFFGRLGRGRWDALPVLVCLAVIGMSTNPIWFCYPWVILALCISAPRTNAPTVPDSSTRAVVLGGHW